MDLAQDVRNYLLEKFQDFNFPGAYSSVDKFYRAIKKDNKHILTRKQIKEFLQSREYYTLLRQVNTNFVRNRVVTPYIGYQIDLDTAHIPQYDKDNSGYIYILAGIDCFSKVAHTVALKSLKSQEFVPALKSLLLKLGTITNCRSDRGPEFRSRATQNLFKKLRINHFFTNNTETKANIVERFFKTLKKLLFTYMLAQNTHKWVDQLQKATNSYNHSYHSSIKQTPASVTVSDEYKIWKQLYETEQPDKIQTDFRFNIHDTVRISVVRHPFMRAFDESWTREHFIIADRIMRDIKPIYVVKDLKNEVLNGHFQENELQKVVVDDNKTYLIEKILKKKRDKVLVKWLGWPKKHSTWMKKSEIEHLQKAPLVT